MKVGAFVGLLVVVEGLCVRALGDLVHVGHKGSAVGVEVAFDGVLVGFLVG